MTARSSSNLLRLESFLVTKRAPLARTSPARGAAAIRIPERLSAQLALVFPSASPQLYVHEGARQALERRLKMACPGQFVVLSITDNRHSIIAHSIQGNVLHARVHHMFLDAPSHVVSALVRYIVNEDRTASQVVGDFIERNGTRLARRLPRAIPIHNEGEHHHLLSIFQELNDRYFGGACNALITWGRHTKRKHRSPRRSIRLGSYAALDRLIRIHPVLDHAWVPRYFVAYVVYHEMLHHMIPSARGRTSLAAGAGARRVLHPPEFLEREKAFRGYERAIAWERLHTARLLRASS